MRSLSDSATSLAKSEIRCGTTGESIGAGLTLHRPSCGVGEDGYIAKAGDQAQGSDASADQDYSQRVRPMLRGGWFDVFNFGEAGGISGCRMCNRPVFTSPNEKILSQSPLDSNKLRTDITSRLDRSVGSSVTRGSATCTLKSMLGTTFLVYCLVDG